MDKTVKTETLQRMARAEGHLKKVVKMIESEEYCPDIIHQSQAVQAALKKVDKLVLHGHLHSCVLKDTHGKTTNEKIIEEIVDLFGKNGK